MNNDKYRSAAVITSTIGRPSLVRAIQSVAKQTYPCTHYVFVDGNQFADQAKAILDEYPQVIAVYLPMNTGANGWSNSAINAIAPFLVKEDVICYLDDDNWYTENHITHCMQTLNQFDVDYVYSLRNFYASEHEFICPDFIESLGKYRNRIMYPLQFNIIRWGGKIPLVRTRQIQPHIDTNCYAIPRKLALSVSQKWYSGELNDRVFFRHLLNLNLKFACTNVFSVNYLFNVYKQEFGMTTFCREHCISTEEMTQICHEILRYEYRLNYQAYGNQYPWENLKQNKI
ncbi:glycosyltransferase family 2 protein [[Pasteurella] aerogenes]